MTARAAIKNPRDPTVCEGIFTEVAEPEDELT